MILFSILGYFTAGIVLLAVFLYLTFPWDKLTRFLEVKVEELTRSSIEVGKSEIRFPLKLVWTDAIIHSSLEDRPIRIHLDRLNVAWAIWPLLKRQLELQWSVDVAGGRGQGQIAAQPTGKGMQFQIRGMGSAIGLGEVIAFFSTNQYDIDGELSVRQIRHDWIGEDFINGSGMAEIEIADVQVKSFDLVFTRVKGQMSIRTDGVALLEHVSAQGPSLDLSGNGDLLLRKKLSSSVINFNSRANIRETSGPLSILKSFASKDSGSQSLELSIRGALKRPTIYINGQSMMSLTSL